MRRLRFFAATPVRGTSIEERLGANPAGRTMVSSFDFRCGITIQSKLPDDSTKLAKSRCGAEERRCSCSDYGCEEQCFGDEIAARILLKILAANVPKRRRRRFRTTAAIAADRDTMVIVVSEREALESC